MSSRRIAKQTLARKLSKDGRVQKMRQEVDMADIEDVAVGLVATKSPYFSPIQTRQQRKTHLNPVQELSKQMPREKILDMFEAQEKELSIVKVNPKKPKIKSANKEKSLPVNAEKTETFTTQEKTWQPANWQQVLQNIREMRAIKVAPVDTMGCHKCSDEDADEKTQRFQKLVALMLSSQTKDETTFEAMKRLKAMKLTPQSIVEMETSKLEALLCPVSFYKNKAKYLQQASRILIDEYDCDIPNDIKGLVALPGVGPKMAHLCMASAWNEVTGIGVDVHVHRITNRLHWLPKETKEPEQTRIALESWLPRDLWQEVNHMLVGFGQTVCTPVRPHCSNCLNRDICPSSDKKNISKEKKN